MDSKEFQYEHFHNLHSMFVSQALSTPDKPAVVSHDGRSLTFAELNEATDILALRLRQIGCRPGSVVAIYLERCLEYPIAYLAALKAGGGYLPLDASYPKHLLESIFEDANPVAVITSDSRSDCLPQTAPLLVLNDGWMERISKENDACDIIPSPHKIGLDDLAYVVYSSGTTGKPKGIMCPHRGAVFSYTWRHENVPFEPDDRVACNVFFVWEMLRPLLKGIPMYVIPDDIIYDPPLLLKYLKKHKISRVLFTPSLLEAVLDCGTTAVVDSLSAMRIIWLCGEVVTTSLRDRFVQILPHVRLMNLYSVSECHDVVASDLTDMQLQDEVPKEKKRKFCPAGKLLPGVHVAVMDENLTPQPVGVSGEIYIGGPTLALGYLNRPELNAQRFIPRPASVPEEFGQRLYKAGDWGYMLSDGQLEICGRCDSMVKIRGYSVELQAIEAALLQLPMVNACTVLAHGEEGTDKYTVAYVVPEGKTSKKEIRAALKTRLPFYMIPAHFILLSSIPVAAASGKLDKSKLPSVEHHEHDEEDEEGKPTTETEKLLTEIWKQVLNLRVVDVQENFFDLGGHSLLIARLLSQVSEKFGVHVSVSDLFKYSTVSAMAGLIDTKSGHAQANGEPPPSPSVTVDLKAEVDYHDQAFVNMDIMLRAFWRSARYNHRWERGRVLLTGSTGFLGAFLLKDLLRLTKVHVYCVIRELPGMSAQDRLEKALQKFGILSKDKSCQLSEEEEFIKQQFESRVIAVKGDVSLLNLGMSEDDFAYLSYEVDFIIHAAASVNLVYPYEALRGPNVHGTQNVLLFACTSKIKPLHYISTDAVFPDGLSNCSESANMMQYAKQLKDGYSQSKWVAEQLVLRAKVRGLPVTIYRLGNMSGERKESNWNPQDFTLLMIQGMTETLAAPDVDWQIEMTPVDFASEVIIKLTQNIGISAGKVFHVINTTPLCCRWLYEWMGAHGYPLEIVSFQEWTKRVKSVVEANTGSSLGLLTRLLESWIMDASFFSNLSSYVNPEFCKVLSTIGLTYPKIDGELLTTYFTALANKQVLPPPKRNTKGPRPLQGQVAIVTGASSGIGAGIARGLAEAGAMVSMAARRLDRLEEMKRAMAADGNVAIAVKTDVTNKDEVKELVRHTENTLGPIDIIVNCAGCMYFTMMRNLHVDEWEKQVDLNCKGVMNGIAAVLTGMISRGKGHIINITSDAGKKVFPGLTVYSASKFFVEALSEGLREEIADTGVKVTTIQPGDVESELRINNTDSEAMEKYDGSTSMKILQPSDIANAVVYALTQPPYCAVNQILIEPREAPI